MHKKNILSNIIRCYKAFSQFNPTLNRWIICQTILLVFSRIAIAMFSLALSSFINKIHEITIWESFAIGVVSFYCISQMMEWIISSTHGRLHTQFVLPKSLHFVNEVIYLMLRNYHLLKMDKNPVELAQLLNKKNDAKGFLGFLFHHLSMPIFELVICSILLMKLGFGWLAFMLIPACVFHFLLSIFVLPQAKAKLRKVLSSNARSSGFFASSMEKANLANTFGTTETLINHMKTVADEETLQFRKSTLLNDAIASLMNLPLAIFSCLFFYFGTQEVLHGGVTYGAFAAFIGIVMNSFSQLRNLTFAFEGLTNSLTALEIHLDIIDKCKLIPQVKFSDNKNTFYNMKLRNFGAIVNNKQLLSINLEIKKNEKIFLVGKSGIGKSSLINAILGYLPHNGEILINDASKPLNMFSWMPQEFLAIEGTIRSNLILGNSYATDEDMWRALKKVHLDDKIKSIGGLDANLLYQGNNMSGGENQRLSLARAILSENHILLLDEPSSAMDMRLEREIFETVNSLEKACIVVVHRLRAIPKNSTVLFIKNSQEYSINKLEFLIENDIEFKNLYFAHEN